MNSMPIFWHKPGLQLPRPDRLNLKSRFTSSKPGDEDYQWISTLTSTYGISLLCPAQKMGTNGRSQNWIFVTNSGKTLSRSISRRWMLTISSMSIPEIFTCLFSNSRARPDKNHGETLIEIGNSRFALFDYLDGYFQFHEQIYFPSRASTFLALAAVSRPPFMGPFVISHLLEESNGFLSKHGPRWRDLKWYREQLAVNKIQTFERLKESPQRALTVIHSRAGWIEDRLTELDEILAAAPLERVIIHGDY